MTRSLWLVIFLSSAISGNGQTGADAFGLSNIQTPAPLPLDISSPFALVAGGSKEIGYGIAEALAKRHYNLILVARHWDSLATAKTKLEPAYDIHVELLAYDLGREESATEIGKWCSERNIPLKVLCNVAGFGGTRDYCPYLLIHSAKW